MRNSLSDNSFKLFWFIFGVQNKRLLKVEFPIYCPFICLQLFEGKPFLNIKNNISI